jgi:hypothetical protein
VPRLAPDQIGKKCLRAPTSSMSCRSQAMPRTRGRGGPGALAVDAPACDLDVALETREPPPKHRRRDAEQHLVTDPVASVPVRAFLLPTLGFLFARHVFDTPVKWRADEEIAVIARVFADGPRRSGA